MLVFGEEVGGDVWVLLLIYVIWVLVIVIVVLLIMMFYWGMDLLQFFGQFIGIIVLWELLLMVICGIVGWKIVQWVGLFGVLIFGLMILMVVLLLLGLIMYCFLVEMIQVV